jgi:hypothetical protein
VDPGHPIPAATIAAPSIRPSPVPARWVALYTIVIWKPGSVTALGWIVRCTWNAQPSAPESASRIGHRSTTPVTTPGRNALALALHLLADFREDGFVRMGKDPLRPGQGRGVGVEGAPAASQGNTLGFTQAPSFASAPNPSTGRMVLIEQSRRLPLIAASYVDPKLRRMNLPDQALKVVGTLNVGLVLPAAFLALLPANLALILFSLAAFSKAERLRPSMDPDLPTDLGGLVLQLNRILVRSAPCSPTARREALP